MRAGAFVSYRRGDTAPQAGRLYDLLVDRLGRQSVFMDANSIEPGRDFTQAIESAISDSSTVIVLIGQDWLSIKNSSGVRRIDTANDYVRTEIEAAIRSGLHIVPLLVNGAEMPAANDLPATIRPLCTRQAVMADDFSFLRDIEPVLDVVERLSSSAMPSWVGEVRQPPTGLKRWDARVLYNQLGTFKDAKWGILLESGAGRFRVEFSSHRFGRKIQVNGRTEWTGGLRDLRRCQIPIHDGAATNFLSFDGDGLDVMPRRWVIRIDGSDLLDFVWGRGAS